MHKRATLSQRLDSDLSSAQACCPVVVIEDWFWHADLGTRLNPLQSLLRSLVPAFHPSHFVSLGAQ